MIGSFSHHKLGNLKIKSALVLLFPLFYLCYVRKIMLPTSDTLFSVNSFDVTKNLLIMIVFAFLMKRFHDSQIKENQRSKEINF
jgi:positive regulator of sigma E activity